MPVRERVTTTLPWSRVASPSGSAPRWPACNAFRDCANPTVPRIHSIHATRCLVGNGLNFHDSPSVARGAYLSHRFPTRNVFAHYSSLSLKDSVTQIAPGNLWFTLRARIFAGIRFPCVAGVIRLANLVTGPIGSLS